MPKQTDQAAEERRAPSIRQKHFDKGGGLRKRANGPGKMTVLMGWGDNHSGKICQTLLSSASERRRVRK